MHAPCSIIGSSLCLFAHLPKCHGNLTLTHRGKAPGFGAAAPFEMALTSWWISAGKLRMRNVNWKKWFRSELIRYLFWIDVQQAVYFSIQSDHPVLMCNIYIYIPWIGKTDSGTISFVIFFDLISCFPCGAAFQCTMWPPCFDVIDFKITLMWVRIFMSKMPSLHLRVLCHHCRQCHQFGTQWHYPLWILLSFSL